MKRYLRLNIEDVSRVHLTVIQDVKDEVASDKEAHLLSQIDRYKAEVVLLRSVVDKLSYKYAISNHHDEGVHRGKMFADKFIAQEREGILDAAIEDYLKGQARKKGIV